MRVSNIARDITAECSTGCPPSLGSDSHTLGYWKFNEGTGSTTADSSSNGHTGTLQGPPPPHWAAVPGCSYSLPQGAGSGFAQTMNGATTATISNTTPAATTTGVVSNNPAQTTH